MRRRSHELWQSEPMGDNSAALKWFGSLSAEQRDQWLADQRAGHRAERLAECERDGHVFESGESECPRCDTPYVAITGR